MMAMTEVEVVAYIQKNEWSSGLKINDLGDKKLHFDDVEASAIYIGPPKSPGRTAYFAHVLSLIGAEDESMFYGALLWISLYGIGSDQIERTGFAMLDMMRRSSGENRPLEAAQGNWFRSGAHVELAAFLVTCLTFAWDAWLVPSRGDLFVYISHDNFIVVVTRNQQAYHSCWKALEHCEPQSVPARILAQLCPNSRGLTSSVPVIQEV